CGHRARVAAGPAQTPQLLAGLSAAQERDVMPARQRCQQRRGKRQLVTRESTIGRPGAEVLGEPARHEAGVEAVAGDLYAAGGQDVLAALAAVLRAQTHHGEIRSATTEVGDQR